MYISAIKKQFTNVPSFDRFESDFEKFGLSALYNKYLLKDLNLYTPNLKLQFIMCVDVSVVIGWDYQLQFIMSVDVSCVIAWDYQLLILDKESPMVY